MGEIVPAPGTEIEECPHEVVAGRLLGGFTFRVTDGSLTEREMPEVDAWCVRCRQRPPEERVRRWLMENLHRFPSARAARRLFGRPHDPSTQLPGGGDHGEGVPGDRSSASVDVRSVREGRGASVEGQRGDPPALGMVERGGHDRD